MEEAATPAGRQKLSEVQRALSDQSFVSSVSSTLPAFSGAATEEELQAISVARAALRDDAWVASRSDVELLPFARSCASGDALVERLAETSAWRARVLPPADDASWEFDHFFAANADRFFPNDELGERPFLEWVRARDGDAEDAPPMQLRGASLLILRPGRHKVGAIDSDTWLRLIAWHGERATTSWARRQREQQLSSSGAAASSSADGAAAEGLGAVTLIVDRRGSGLRNQDPALLRALLPPLTRHFPYSLHMAYVAPINVVFWAIWAVARLALPRAVTQRFMLLSGDDWRAQLDEALGPVVAARLPD